MKIFFAFASKAISFVILFLLCKDGVLFTSSKTFDASSIIFASLLNFLAIIYITSLIFIFRGKPFDLTTRHGDRILPNLHNGTHGIFKKAYRYNYGYIFLRHKKSKNKGVFSIGCWPLGVILIKGDLGLTDSELEAVIWHEIYHIQYCNIAIRFFILFLLKDILIPIGIAGFFLCWAIFWQIGYFSEFLADRYAKAKSPGGQYLMTAVKKLSGKTEIFYEILEYIPFLNIMLVTHPCKAFRGYFVASS